MGADVPLTAAPPAPPPAKAPLSEEARLQAEKDQKEKTLQEKQGKRAAVVATILCKLLTSFYLGRQQMFDAARAAEAAKRAMKGKGKKKKSKKASAEKPPKGTGKSKKPTKTPIQEACSVFLLEMDEKINKLKRVYLEDLYRGVAALDERGQSMLAALLATTNSKILPTAAMNINQLNIVAALQAASAAAGLGTASAVPTGGNPGLSILRDRGASSLQLLQFGYNEADQIRVGVARHSVVAACHHNLGSLREAGILPGELLSCPGSGPLSADLVSGVRGVQALRTAGFTAGELNVCGVSNPWTLRQAGYTLGELIDGALISAPALRAAGFGLKESIPAGFMSSSVACRMQEPDAATLPLLMPGTQVWPTQIVRSSSSRALEPTRPPSGSSLRPPSGAIAPNMSSLKRSAVLPSSASDMVRS
mmetsp:Transcript_14612/g.25492  ORF Transcript_14612/g.25492 Transcript_14612/m.25492 type:complete len:421 (+) Transcript_14612:197-1459(+)|eukprot:CAMPEP_0119112492 /NCGR_PEP_ID=MMETSP1180-20130426/40493_1 /TAXON_ID=3052 ORGANISM="Chlamydomonas cf sp, Strain CCMP681" /NCGR_SAMPLE_ID=MMETSP1180 /ASSEMBLY_ACC=CAM_ASM_000741 /LENGTH=420 /DNA_ID=CAMNT_0007100023 /DNA_START=118 /DNA_END=1380 /DNA_ORIENTATION=+